MKARTPRRALRAQAGTPRNREEVTLINEWRTLTRSEQDAFLVIIRGILQRRDAKKGRTR